MIGDAAQGQDKGGFVTSALRDAAEGGGGRHGGGGPPVTDPPDELIKRLYPQLSTDNGIHLNSAYRCMGILSMRSTKVPTAPRRPYCSTGDIRATTTASPISG